MEADLHIKVNGEWVAWDGIISLGDELASYKAQDIDEANDTKYYGYVETDGAWYILRVVTSTGTLRYTKGTSDYPTGWTGRAGHTYGYLDVIF